MIHDGIQLTVKNCTRFQILIKLNSHQWLKIMTFCIKNSHGICFVIFTKLWRDYLWKRCHWWRLFRDIIFSMGKLNRNANMCGDVSCTKKACKSVSFFSELLLLLSWPFLFGTFIVNCFAIRPRVRCNYVRSRATHDSLKIHFECFRRAARRLGWTHCTKLFFRIQSCNQFYANIKMIFDATNQKYGKKTDFLWMS